MHLMDTQVLVQATDGEEVGLGVMGVLEVLEDLSHRMETSAVLEWVSMEDQDFKEVLVLDILEDGVVQGLTCRVTMNLVSQGKRKAPLAKRTWRKFKLWSPSPEGKLACHLCRHSSHSHHPWKRERREAAREEGREGGQNGGKEGDTRCEHERGRSGI